MNGVSGMNASAYYAERTRLQRLAMESVALQSKVSAQRSSMLMQQWDHPYESAARDVLTEQITPLSKQYDELDDMVRDLRRQLDELDAAVTGGFDYVRPTRSHFINRLLPSVPQGTKEVMGDKADVTASTSIRLLAVAMAASTFVLALAGLFFLGWLLTPSGSSSGSEKLQGFEAAVLLVVGMVLFSSPLGSFSRSLSIRQQYLLGAYSWTWSERLRSCLVYTFDNAMAWLYLPIVAPLRFGVGMVIMIVYLRRFNVGDTESRAIMVSAELAKAFTRYTVILVGSGMLVVAFMLLVV